MTADEPIRARAHFNHAGASPSRRPTVVERVVAPPAPRGRDRRLRGGRAGGRRPGRRPRSTRGAGHRRPIPPTLVLVESATQAWITVVWSLALSQGWGPGDRVVVDNFAYVSSWAVLATCRAVVGVADRGGTHPGPTASSIRPPGRPRSTTAPAWCWSPTSPPTSAPSRRSTTWRPRWSGPRRWWRSTSASRSASSRSTSAGSAARWPSRRAASSCAAPAAPACSTWPAVWPTRLDPARRRSDHHHLHQHRRLRAGAGRRPASSCSSTASRCGSAWARRRACAVGRGIDRIRPRSRRAPGPWSSGWRRCPALELLAAAPLPGIVSFTHDHARAPDRGAARGRRSSGVAGLDQRGHARPGGRRARARRPPLPHYSTTDDELDRLERRPAPSAEADPSYPGDRTPRGPDRPVGRTPWSTTTLRAREDVGDRTRRQQGQALGRGRRAGVRDGARRRLPQDRPRGAHARLPPRQGAPQAARGPPRRGRGPRRGAARRHPRLLRPGRARARRRRDRRARDRHHRRRGGRARSSSTPWSRCARSSPSPATTSLRVDDPAPGRHRRGDRRPDRPAAPPVRRARDRRAARGRGRHRHHRHRRLAGRRAARRASPPRTTPTRSAAARSCPSSTRRCVGADGRRRSSSFERRPPRPRRGRAAALRA